MTKINVNSISTIICSAMLQTACQLINAYKQLWKCKGISKHLIFTIFSQCIRIVGFGSIALTIITYEKDPHKSMCPVRITVRVNTNSKYYNNENIPYCPEGFGWYPLGEPPNGRPPIPEKIRPHSGLRETEQMSVYAAFWQVILKSAYRIFTIQTIFRLRFSLKSCWLLTLWSSYQSNRKVKIWMNT